MTQELLQGLCDEWQKRLRLQDWKVKISLCRMRDMDDCYGRTKTRRNWKEADIQIADVTDRAGDSPDIEQTIIHELMHLHFSEHTPDGGASLVLFENGIDLTAWALLNLKRGQSELKP